MQVGILKLLATLATLVAFAQCTGETTQSTDKPRASTRRASVRVVDHLPAPELKGVHDTLEPTRRVWVYTPVGFNPKDTVRYPVLYLFDGQNLFDDSTSFVGEWGIDETLDSLQLPIIVVGVDHGNARRAYEYTPFISTQDKHKVETGGGTSTMAWLLNRVKPWVEQNYPVQGRAFLGGASLGGLMALYGEIEHPNVFEASLVFSPAYWINAPQIFELARRRGHNLRVFQLAGYREGGLADYGSVVRDMQRMDDSLRLAGVDTAHRLALSDSLGEHNEAFWRRYAGRGIAWLLAHPAGVHKQPSPAKRK